MRRGDIDMKSPFRAHTFDEDNHFMQIEVEDQKITFQAISKGGDVIDRGIIT